MNRQSPDPKKYPLLQWTREEIEEDIKKAGWACIGYDLYLNRKIPGPESLAHICYFEQGVSIEIGAIEDDRCNNCGFQPPRTLLIGVEFIKAFPE